MTTEDTQSRQGRMAALFAGELEDRTGRLEDGLLQLEHATPADRQALLEELVRAAHTLKGSAAMLGITQVATISHELEDALAPLRSRTQVDTETVTRLLADVDRLRRAGAEALGPARADDPEVPPAATEASAPASEGPRPATVVESVRLPSRRLDALVDRTASLRVASGSLVALTQGVDEARRQLLGGGGTSDRSGEGAAIAAAAASLDDVGRRIRPLLRTLDRAVQGVDVAVRDVVTVPVAEACQGLARQVRDITATRDTDVALHTDVEGVEIDRQAVAAVRDALVHLVRNAADHGIEGPPERRAAGKPAQGVVEVSATVAADQVRVAVRDDGRGIDEAAVRAAAESAGLADDASAGEMVFVPGLSTARTTTEVSGRGIGMDAVREAVESLGGTVALESQPGVGTTVTLAVPASVATARVLLVEVGGHRTAILLRGVRRLVRVPVDDVVVSDGRSWLRQDDQMLLVAPLADVVGFAVDEPVTPSPRRPAVVVESVDQSVALLVDRVVGEEEVLVRSLGELVERLPGVVTAGVLAHGQVVLVLHPAALVRLAWDRPTTALPRRTQAPESVRPRVLLAEDAPTTQALERGLLEAAGYEVIAASDGLQAWNVLTQQPVDVVVSDIDMPRLDGISLCERIRSSPTLWELPVVLVTSRETEQDRRRGADAGADAYLLKSAFAQGDLTSTIARMLA